MFGAARFAERPTTHQINLSSQETPEFVAFASQLKAMNQLLDGQIESVEYRGDSIVDIHLTSSMDAKAVGVFAEQSARKWAKMEGTGLPVFVNIYQGGEKMITRRGN